MPDVEFAWAETRRDASDFVHTDTVAIEHAELQREPEKQVAFSGDRFFTRTDESNHRSARALVGDAPNCLWQSRLLL